MTKDEFFIATPHTGVGPIRFGMTCAEVESILGAPSSQTTTAGIEDSEWNYETLGMRLSFDKDYDFRLARVALESPRTVIAGLRPVLLPEQELLDRAPALGGLVLEDVYESVGARDYWSERLSASFWVVDGRVESITILPAYDGDNPIWPANDLP